MLTCCDTCLCVGYCPIHWLVGLRSLCQHHSQVVCVNHAEGRNTKQISCGFQCAVHNSVLQYVDNESTAVSLDPGRFAAVIVLPVGIFFAVPQEHGCAVWSCSDLYVPVWGGGSVKRGTSAQLATKSHLELAHRSLHQAWFLRCTCLCVLVIVDKYFLLWEYSRKEVFSSHKERRLHPYKVEKPLGTQGSFLIARFQRC